MLAGVLVPQITLAIPQYLLLPKLGLVGTTGRCCCPASSARTASTCARVYAGAAVPDDMLEAGRIDGAGEYRLLRSVGLPLMMPGMVTVFLLQFIAIWNNFLLPYIMLADDEPVPDDRRALHDAQPGRQPARPLHRW